MVAGGFAVANHRIHEIETNVAALRVQAGVNEFHWSAYKGGSTRHGYEALVDYAFELVHNGHAALHVLVSPFKGYRHKAKPGENLDTSVNRMYFQLLLHRPAKFYGKTREIHVRLDAGNDSADICKLREELCAKAYNQHKTRPNCVRSLQAMPSENSGLIQMADVILGGIAAKRNSITHTSEKGPLADRILEKSRHADWSEETHFNARKLTLWNFSGSK